MISGSLPINIFSVVTRDAKIFNYFKSLSPTFRLAHCNHKAINRLCLRHLLEFFELIYPPHFIKNAILPILSATERKMVNSGILPIGTNEYVTFSQYMDPGFSPIINFFRPPNS